MAQTSTIRRIIWSLDAFETSADLKSHSAEALKSLIHGRKIQVEPVYVLSPDQLDLPLDFTPPWVDRYRPAAEKALDQMLRSFKVKGLEKPRVLVYKHASLSGSVHALISYAKASAADLIVMGSHGRKGLQRIFLGSFAEALLLQAKVPVLVVGPKAEHKERVEEILFPTDFGKNAFPVFKRVVELAKELGARITILHAIPRPIEPVFQSGVYLLGGVWIPAPEFMKEHEVARRQGAKKWIDHASALGVMADLVIDADARGAVESILLHAKKRKSSMIAMAAQSGPVASTLIGSVTRQTVRSAPCPVWVLRAPSR